MTQAKSHSEKIDSKMIKAEGVTGHKGSAPGLVNYKGRI
jgi:hypothetical protein